MEGQPEVEGDLQLKLEQENTKDAPLGITSKASKVVCTMTGGAPSHRLSLNTGYELLCSLN